jgi:hypothetical protein
MASVKLAVFRSFRRFKEMATAKCVLMLTPRHKLIDHDILQYRPTHALSFHAEEYL